MKKNISKVILIAMMASTLASCSAKAKDDTSTKATTLITTIAQKETSQVSKSSDSSKSEGNKTITVTKAKESASNSDNKTSANGGNNTEVKNNNNNSNNTASNNQGSNDATSSNKLVIVTKDTQNFEKKELKSIDIDASKSVEENLGLIATELSKEVFEGNEIKIKEIKEEDGKKVAHIDLVNKEKWNNFFQGSTGGSITQFTLIDSFLQRNYTGEWIDGVKFTIDDKDIEYDHTPGLSDTRFKVEEAN